MATCKLTKSLDNKLCEYAVAGASRMLLANWYPPTTGTASAAGVIAYEVDVDGYISGINLPTDEFFYELKPSENTLRFGDGLLANGNGGKYRQHSINAVLNQYDIDVLNQGDALSLGKFIAVVLDNANRWMLLGRTSGLSAPPGGFDYDSGAAEADATGWTLIQQGRSTELAPLIKDATVITPIYEEEVEP